MKNKLIIGITVLAVLLGLWIYQFGFSLTPPRSASLTINGETFSVEVVAMRDAPQSDLFGRTRLGERNGMLFEFPSAEVRSIRMKSIKSPVDIIWIVDDTIVGFEKNVSPASGSDAPVYNSPKAVNRVLEVGAGTVEKFRWGGGDKAQVIFL